MFNFGELVKMEYRKLFQRKLVWITIAVLTAGCIFAGISGLLGKYYINGEQVDTHANMLRTDTAYARRLSGQAVDDALIGRMQEAYGKVPQDAQLYVATSEYQTYARPYSEIHNFVLRIAENRWDTVTSGELYDLRRAAVEQGWTKMFLTAAEKTYLSGLEDQLTVPFTYRYDDGYTNYLSLLYMVAVLMLLGVAVCVPQIFSEEYSRRTDSLIASSPLGKKPLYLAKIVTGLTFSLGLALLLAAVTAVSVFSVYGPDGFSAAIQLDYPTLSWKLTVGEAALLLTGIFLLSSLLFGAVAMLLSLAFRNTAPAMALLLAYLLVTGIFNIPDEYRIAGQLWSYFPVNSCNLTNAFSQRLLQLGDTFLAGWQVTCLLYPVVTVIFLLISYHRYRKIPS